MFASSPFRGSFLRGVLALSVKPCRACQLSQRESSWQCGKVSGSSAKFADSDQKTEQKLHYLGIPLKANWNFLDKKLFTLYVSGGGMIEKCVYGKLGTEKETVKPLQFSVSGAVGAQFNATKRVGIYVEPGVAYFFDDGSDVQTIRKENPFNFNIQAGIRLTY